jgi:FkbM family methyltransferase
MELKQSLGPNGEYDALFGEVVTYDVYHVKDVPNIVSCNDPNYVHWQGHSGIVFTPDTVLDLGANVGIFSRYARELWPNATIIAVEPNGWNQSVFEEHTKGVTLIKAAIGLGQLYHCNGAVNGAHESYLSKGLGYNQLAFDELNKLGITEDSNVPSVMLTDLKKYCNGKVLLKLDIEGNETIIFNDPESMELMKTFEYICMELHYFASDGSVLDSVKAKTAEALESLKETHNTRFDHIYFYATKR